MKKIILMALLALPMSLFAQKFAHVNSAEIIQAMPEYTAAQTKLQNLQKTYEDELNRMQDELKTKAEDYEKNRATLLEPVQQRREQDHEAGPRIVDKRARRRRQDPEHGQRDSDEVDTHRQCDGGPDGLTGQDP